MSVVWTRRARARLQVIHRHIHDQAGSAATADRVVEPLLRRSMQLGLPGMARSGRPVPEYAASAVLELVVAPYRIIHSVRAERIDVLTVMHPRQLLPGDVDRPD